MHSFVVENAYTDSEYLDDYGMFYSACNRGYDRICRRIHFFRKPAHAPPILLDEDFERLLEDASEPIPELFSDYQDAYLGFSVARPLPEAVVGRTIVRPWDDDGGRRNYSALGKHSSHLFGITFETVALPFQEQDSATAACATVALWIALEQASRRFRSTWPRPARITEIAANVSETGRIMPNGGLTLSQVVTVIRSAGLELEFGNLLNLHGNLITPWLSFLRGYLLGGLPVILIVRSQGSEDLHAVVACGFGMHGESKHTKECSEQQSIRSKGLWLEELYIHDDQRGPYCHYFVEHAPSEDMVGIQPVLREWKEHPPEEEEQRVLYVKYALVPLDDKIRVSYTAAYGVLVKLGRMLSSLTAHKIASGAAVGVTWDCWITTTSDVKAELLKRQDAVPRYKELLLRNLPKYMWRAVCFAKDCAIWEVFLDATDTPRSPVVIRSVWHSDALRQKVEESLQDEELSASLRKVVGSALIEWMQSEI